MFYPPRTGMNTSGNTESAGKQVSILIPHFETPEVIRLCLRSIRKYTSMPIQTIVLDNGSRDDSLAYLRSVAWIKLVETGIPNHTRNAHYLSLNEAVKTVDTPYFLTMHSDTFVHNPGWLEYLLRTLEQGDFAAVGPRHQRIPVCTFWWLLFSILRNSRVREFKPGVPIVRSFCTLYRTDPFRKLNCEFHTSGKEDITYAPNEILIRSGFRVQGIPASEMSRHIFHASAMTLISRAEGGSPDRPAMDGDNYLSAKILRRSGRAMEKFMSLPSTRAILADSSLDE